MTHADIRYLEAKRTVDDRALSRRIRDGLLEALPPEPRILEVGCGTGTMVPRLYGWGVRSGSYRGIDRDEGVIAFARRARPKELRYEAGGGGDRDAMPDIRHPDGDVGPSPVIEDRNERHESGIEGTETDFAVGDLTVAFETGEAIEAATATAPVDLFVASGFADLVPIPRLLDAVETSLRPGGLAYVPITFDGGTIFQPDHPADPALERAFHRAIDATPGRDARAGRHLADRLQNRSGDLVAMAGSDWIVRPRGDGYPADEAFFLERILDIVETTIGDSGEQVVGFEGWLEARREQLSRARLTYIAHQYDLLYRNR